MFSTKPPKKLNFLQGGQKATKQKEASSFEAFPDFDGGLAGQVLPGFRAIFLNGNAHAYVSTYKQLFPCLFSLLTHPKEVSSPNTHIPTWQKPETVSRFSHGETPRAPPSNGVHFSAGALEGMRERMLPGRPTRPFFGFGTGRRLAFSIFYRGSGLTIFGLTIFIPMIMHMFFGGKRERSFFSGCVLAFFGEGKGVQGFVLCCCLSRSAA